MSAKSANIGWARSVAIASAPPIPTAAPISPVAAGIGCDGSECRRAVNDTPPRVGRCRRDRARRPFDAHIAAGTDRHDARADRQFGPVAHRVQRPGRLTVDPDIDPSGQLGEGGRAVGRDVEHPVVRLGFRDLDRAPRRPPDPMTTGGKADPGGARPTGGHRDVHDVVRGDHAIVVGGRGGREFDPCAVSELLGIDEAAVLGQDDPVDGQSTSERRPDRPQEIGDPVVDRVRMHGDPLTTGGDGVETRRSRRGGIPVHAALGPRAAGRSALHTV
jgi:hypothetical protein